MEQRERSIRHRRGLNHPLHSMQIATAGGPDKAALLRRLGADRVVDYKQESLKVGGGRAVALLLVPPLT